MENKYQLIRLTLLNHREAPVHSVLSSLQFLVENKLMHKEWKRFEQELLLRFSQQYTFPADSIENLLALTLTSEDELLIAEILTEMEVDQLMRDEFLLYDEMQFQRAKDALMTSLENALELVESPEDVVSIVMNWYKFIKPSSYSTEQI